MESLTSFLLGFALNFAVAFTIVRFIYFPVTRSKQYVFSFLSFNIIIYLVLLFMPSIELSAGAGFGLFAIFTILRYRTDPIPIREMTYLFFVLALPVINSAITVEGNLVNLVVANALVILILVVLEKNWGFKYENMKKIRYERIDLIKPDKRDLMIADLIDRTGLDITRVEIGNMNFLRDSAEIKIYYNEPDNGYWDGGNGAAPDDDDDEQW